VSFTRVTNWTYRCLVI